MTAFHITQVTSEQDCSRCFAVMRELRPHLSDASAFGAQVRRQTRDGYYLLAAWRDEQVVGLIGYRIQENLMNGRFLFVDDLVVRADERRIGLGARLLDAARQKARDANCRQLVLDTGLGMALAQRFYFRQGLLTRSIGFYEQLAAEADA
ncbi:GNAT family N-acetyltransferase [Salinisphaera hydrothermalis]|uniref:GNAT family N-acetyltransferase n=1 Tax=Salinisphaera hydrothermalis TaxID=563188 RepID=UPI00333EF126